MKTRSDFVSNSSSCSFVIAITDRYKIKDFINDLVEDTLSTADSEDSPAFIETVKESNLRNLYYHLNCTELLFLGSLKTADKVEVYKNETDEDNWNEYKEMDRVLNDSYLKSHPEEKDFEVEEKTDTEMRVRYNTYAENLTVPSECMEYTVGRYPFKKEYEDHERKTIAKTIYEFASRINCDTDSFMYHMMSRIYKITQNTIDNTRDLIDSGYKVVLDDWQNLDELEKRIKEGKKIFGIQLSNGGDGMSDTTIYGLGGWDAQIGEKAEFETIYSECG